MSVVQADELRIAGIEAFGKVHANGEEITLAAELSNNSTAKRLKIRSRKWSRENGLKMSTPTSLKRVPYTGHTRI